MSDFLTAGGLIALSVRNLEAAIDEGTYDAETLAEALELETARDDARKTAIEALEDALCDARKTEILALDANAKIKEQENSINLNAQLGAVKATIAEIDALADAELEPEATVYKVPKGKAVTTHAGIKTEGQKVTAKMVTGGVDKLKLLKSKGLLV